MFYDMQPVPWVQPALRGEQNLRITLPELILLGNGLTGKSQHAKALRSAWKGSKMLSKCNPRQKPCRA